MRHDNSGRPRAPAPRSRASAPYGRGMRRLRRKAAFVALVGALAPMACADFHLSTSNFDVSPNPARAGDEIVAVFILSLIPTQSHTITVLIDDTPYLQVTNSGPPALPVVVELGDAADLIARYGPGAHTARIEVHANAENESTRTASVSLELVGSAP
jgi:hypothetical protein